MAVVSVLVLISVGAGLLAALGEALFMGSPVYLVVPVLKSVLLLVLCAWMARGRRWAVVTMLVVQTLALVGFGFGLLLGLTPWFAASVTLSGLLTGVGVPVAVLWVCVGLLRRPHALGPAPPVAGSRSYQAVHQAPAARLVAASGQFGAVHHASVGVLPPPVGAWPPSAAGPRPAAESGHFGAWSAPVGALPVGSAVPPVGLLPPQPGGPPRTPAAWPPPAGVPLPAAESGHFGAWSAPVGALPVGSAVPPVGLLPPQPGGPPRSSAAYLPSAAEPHHVARLLHGAGPSPLAAGPLPAAGPHHGAAPPPAGRLSATRALPTEELR